MGNDRGDGVRFLPPPPYGTAKEVIQFYFERVHLQTRRFFDGWPADANLDVTHEGGLRAMRRLFCHSRSSGL